MDNNHEIFEKFEEIKEEIDELTENAHNLIMECISNVTEKDSRIDVLSGYEIKMREIGKIINS